MKIDSYVTQWRCIIFRCYTSIVLPQYSYGRTGGAFRSVGGPAVWVASTCGWALCIGFTFRRREDMDQIQPSDSRMGRGTFPRISLGGDSLPNYRFIFKQWGQLQRSLSPLLKRCLTINGTSLRDRLKHRLSEL